MAEGNWSVIRVEKISAEGAQKTERHNERKNESYANLNVDTEQIARNVHFKDTGGLTYNEYFQRLIDEGKISTRGQKAGATVFNELVIDVNTRYFEEHGGYEYAKQFYEEAYRFGCEIYGEENIVSAVMHADEINKAVSEELGKPVYHYHLRIVAIPRIGREMRNPAAHWAQPGFSLCALCGWNKNGGLLLTGTRRCRPGPSQGRAYRRYRPRRYPWRRCRWARR